MKSLHHLLAPLAVPAAKGTWPAAMRDAIGVHGNGTAEPVLTQGFAALKEARDACEKTLHN